MRGVYSGTVEFTGLAAAKNLMVLTAPSNAIIEILEASITDANNETNEQLKVAFFRSGTAGTGSSTTIVQKPHEPGDQASNATLVHSYVTTEPVLETDPIGKREGFATLSGWFYDSIPEGRIYVPPSGIFVLRIITPGFAAFDCMACMTYRLIG